MTPTGSVYSLLLDSSLNQQNRFKSYPLSIEHQTLNTVIYF